MAQLESAENLAKITDPRWRLLFPLLMETGLRINDALHLPQDCVIHDQQNAPYLRYLNRKMKREALVPISPEMAAAINEQAARVRTQYSAKAVLFPRQTMNPDGSHPASMSAHRAALNTWIQQCRIVDETGAPMRITPHQFRHTLGTRLNVRGIASAASLGARVQRCGSVDLGFRPGGASRPTFYLTRLVSCVDARRPIGWMHRVQR